MLRVKSVASYYTYWYYLIFVSGLPRFRCSGAFGERTHMVRRLFGKELLSKELENRRDQDRHSVPLLDMAGRRSTQHHQSSFGIPQVTMGKCSSAFGMKKAVVIMTAE